MVQEKGDLELRQLWWGNCGDLGKMVEVGREEKVEMEWIERRSVDEASG